MIKKLFQESLKKELFLTVGIFKFYFVDIDQVNEIWTSEFTEGGHYLRYAFIPEKEFWIQKGMSDKNTKRTVVHELTEVLSMIAFNITYDDGHDEYAKVIEDYIDNNMAYKDKGSGIDNNLFVGGKE
jgi:hypothetical protein